VQVGGHVGPEEELHAVAIPAIQMLGLREVGIAADEDLAEAAFATNADGPINLGGGAFV
jgi:hypothetical protein